MRLKGPTLRQSSRPFRTPALTQQIAKPGTVFTSYIEHEIKALPFIGILLSNSVLKIPRNPLLPRTELNHECNGAHRDQCDQFELLGAKVHLCTSQRTTCRNRVPNSKCRTLAPDSWATRMLDPARLPSYPHQNETYPPVWKVLP